MACRPEPHRRFTLNAGVPSAQPPLMAEHHVAYILAFHAGARQRFLDDQRAQFGGGHILEAAAKGANGRAHCADDDDFTGHGKVLSDQLRTK